MSNDYDRMQERANDKKQRVKFSEAEVCWCKCTDAEAMLISQFELYFEMAAKESIPNESTNLSTSRAAHTFRGGQ